MKRKKVLEYLFVLDVSLKVTILLFKDGDENFINFENIL